jgi:hypothetical protein
MNYKNKRKLSTNDIQNKTAFYNRKLEEYKLLSLDELQALYIKGGISSTDRQAIVVATNHLLRERANEIAKGERFISSDGKEEEEITG